MIDLPLAEEVREARRLAVRAEAAMRLVQQAHQDAEIARITLQAVQATGATAVSIPGEETVARAAAEFPELAHLALMWPPPAAGIVGRLHSRLAQLNMALMVLNPIGAEHNDRSTHIHKLQHQQSDLLAAPEFAQAMAILATKFEERKTWLINAEALTQKMARLRPFTQLVQTLMPGINADILALPSLGAQARAAAKLRAIRDTLATLNDSGEPLPDVSPLDVTPITALAFGQVIDGVLAAARLAQQRFDEMRAQQEAATLQADTATKWILDRTG